MIIRMPRRLGDVDRFSYLVEQAKARFPYVVFLPFLSGNPNRGGHDLFSAEGIRAYNPDRRFQAPVFQAAYGTHDYNEAAISDALETIFAGGVPAGATASGPAQTSSPGGGSGSVVTDLFPDLPGEVVSSVGKYALPAAAIAAMIFLFKWRP